MACILPLWFFSFFFRHLISKVTERISVKRIQSDVMVKLFKSLVRPYVQEPIAL